MIAMILGLLACGTNKGSLSLFKIVKTSSSPSVPVPATNFSFTISDLVEVLEEDGLKIVSIEFLSVLASQSQAKQSKTQKSSKLNLVIVKHPNYVLTKEVTLAKEEVTVNMEVQHLKSPQGLITGTFLNLRLKQVTSARLIFVQFIISGVSRHSDDRIAFCHQSGAFSAVSLPSASSNSGVLLHSDDFIVQISPDSTPHIFNGLCFSPNKALACVGRQLSCHFHPVNVKEIGRASCRERV